MRRIHLQVRKRLQKLWKRGCLLNAPGIKRLTLVSQSGQKFLFPIIVGHVNQVGENILGRWRGDIQVICKRFLERQ